MDAAGSTTSIFHLMHQCFVYIQQARAFEEEFGFYQLQLKVHLSRCAHVSRIIHDTNGADNSLAINAIDGHQEPTIAEILSAIQDKLRKAEQEAAKMEADFVEIGSPELEGVDDLKAMRVRITRFLDKQKAQATKKVEGIKWAFYKKEKHEKFITEISALIKHLERKVTREGFGILGVMYIARAQSSIMYEAEDDV